MFVGHDAWAGAFWNRRTLQKGQGMSVEEHLATTISSRFEAGGEPRATRRRHGIGFWVVALAFLTGMAFSTIPTPLYPLYQQREGFSTFTVTVVFAVYAVGVIISLILAGHISDWIGRKRVLIPALGIEALAAILFLVWPDLAGLLIARFVTGLGVGMLTATATAYLNELHGVHHPSGGRGRFEIVSTAANIGGLGVGPLVAGALAQFVTSPLTVPYLVFLALLMLSMIGVAVTPETVRQLPQRPSYRPQALGGAASGRVFWEAAGSAFAAFAIFGIFTSVAPGFVAGTLNEPSRLLAGVSVFVVFGAAALAQSTTNRIGGGARLAIGLVGETAGLITLAAGMIAVSFPAFLIGGALAGASAGILFKSAIGTVVASTDASKRGGALASVFLVAYLGLIVPSLAIGVTTLYTSAALAMLWFSAALVVLLAVLARYSVRSRSASRA
ncbi:MAG: putative transporter [Microbacteriaceae bacterium]|nr:putative transporter [Microbacteriaceae bacterium]